MRRSEMKRTGFFKGMLDGLRSSVSQPVKSEAEVEENLRPDQFQVAKTVRHGFPYQPTAMAFDPVQRLLAIGTKNGALRIFGRPGVDCFVQHVLECAIIQIIFLINEGALITVCSDDTLHLWNLRQKKPEIVHTLKFQKERITYCHLPFQSKWLYIGSERGNVHVVNVESFLLSGYVINWNKAIELSRKTHPGAVIHLSDNPVDPNKLLIGFECGQIVLWDLRNKAADMRCLSAEPLKSVSWHNEGKQFMCSHTDGSLTTWNIRTPQKAVTTMYPHAKAGKDGKLEPCKCIYKVEWKTVRAADSFVIFSGGLPVEKGGKTPSLTVINGKTTTVLEMEHNIIDFITLCESPWQSVEFQEPYAIVVLLYNDLVVVDLTTTGYPCFQNPYPMDLHESPVTFCTYLADCPTDLIPAFYSVGCKTSKRAGFSENEWPINGGEWGTGTVSYPEIMITGHADGTLKFWDASAVSLQVLYKLKTAKVFEKPKAKSFDSQEEDPFALEKVAFCPESRVLCVAGASSHVVLFRFCRQEATAEVPTLEIPIVYEIDDEPDCSPDCEYPPRPNLGQASQQGSFSSAAEETRKVQTPMTDYYVPLKVKGGPIKKSPGFQAELVCLTPWVNGEPPGHITALKINSSYGLMAYGNECGLAVVDIVQRTCLLNMGTPDLYGSSDPYQRIPRSPKKNTMGNNENNNNNEQDRCRSPTTTDQLDSAPPITSDPPVQKPDKTTESEPAPCGSTFYVTKPSPSSDAPGELEPTAPPLPPPRTKKTFRLKERKKSKVSAPNEEIQEFLEPLACKSMLTEEPEITSLSENEACQAVVPDLINPEVAEEAIDVCYWPKAEGAAMSSTKNSNQSVSSNKEYIRQMSSDSLGKCSQSDTDNAPYSEIDSVKLRNLRRNSRKFSIKCKSKVIDLRDESESVISPVFKIMNKIDSSFSRSRSSSMSSLENISSEAIQCLTFCDSYTRKGDAAASPSLWVGTSLGSVLVIMLTIPGGIESRQTQPVIVSPSGSIFRLKGSIQSISFLDCNGALVPCLYEPWRDTNTPEKKIKTPSGNPQKMRVSPTSSSDIRDTQYVVMTSEKQVRVVSLPSQTCMYKMPLTETSFVVASEVVSIKGTDFKFADSVCLACYIGNGNIVVYTLPSLKILCEVDFLPLMDIRIARTFCFSNNGHGMYLCSPSELQKFTISSNFCENLQEMMATIFLTKDMPEAPKQGFFRGLFGGGPSSLDRQELFGEASGKPSKSVARHIPGNASSVEYVKGQTSTLASELAKARQGLTERGEHLNLLEERTARMMTEAESFANASHQLMSKYRDKKWYQF